jgi:hypothetical protein
LLVTIFPSIFQKNREGTIPTNGEETGNIGSSEVHENGNGEEADSSDVHDDNAPSSSYAVESDAGNQALMPDSSAKSPEDNGVKEADSGPVDSSDNHDDDMNVESPVEEDAGLVESSVTESVDFKEGSPGNDNIAENTAPGDVEPEIDQEEADRLLGSPSPAEDEDAGVSSTAQEESTEQDQSVPECSSGVADEAMETDNIEAAGEVGSETPDDTVTESTNDAAKDEDSVVPVGDNEPSPSYAVEKDDKVKESVEESHADADVKAESTEMEVEEDRNNDAASESAVVPGEKNAEAAMEVSDVSNEKDASKESDLPSEKESAQTDTSAAPDEVKIEDSSGETKTEGKTEDKTDTKEEADVEMVDAESKKSPGDGDTEKKEKGEAIETEEAKASSPTETASEAPKEAEVEEKKEEQNVLKASST